MEVLLISANKEATPYPVAPLGLAYIASFLKRSGNDVEIIDLCFSSDDMELLRNVIEKTMPKLIGISIRNIDNLTYPKSIFYLPYIKEIVDFIKDISNATILAGGSGFSLFPEETLRYLNIDYGIVGEGENAITSFVNFMSNGNIFYEIPSLCYIRDDSFYSNAIMREEGFQDFPSPDRAFIDNEAYLKLGGMGNIQSKRGCPFQCSYCTYPYINGRQLRLRQPKDIVDEIEEMRNKYDVNYLFFVDDIFNYPREHAVGICEEIIKRNININWTCFATPKGMSQKLTELMKKAGCNGIEFGTDSGSEKILRSLNKSFSLYDIEKATEFCKNTAMPAAHYVIIGGPGENEETLKETFSFFDSIKPDAVIAMTGIRIYPNTMLSKLCRDEGVIKQDTDLLSPEFYISPDLGADKMIAMVKEHTQSRPNWIVPGLDIRCSTEVLTMLRKLGKRGPLWDLIVTRN